VFKLLDVDDPEWLARLLELPPDRRDLHFSPRLLAVYKAAFGWKVGLAITQYEKHFVLEPVVVDNGQRRHAYNYGGPVSNSESSVAMLSHWLLMDKWDRANGVEKVYTTFNPHLIEHQKALLGTHRLNQVKDTVWIDLNRVDIRGTTRRLAIKAQEAGVTVNATGDDGVEVFHKMYTETMQRQEAAVKWFFPLKFFKAYYRLVRPALLLTFYEGQPQSGCLVARGGNGIAYYHFAGSFNKHPQLGINHMMVLAAAEYAHKNLGATALHLGGGVTPNTNDGLFIFKSGFSSERAPVYTLESSYALKAA
jgi:Acetyltransferase (GNAT) domain